MTYNYFSKLKGKNLFNLFFISFLLIFFISFSSSTSIGNTSVKGVVINKPISATPSGAYVPYNGANQNVNLGNYNLTLGKSVINLGVINTTPNNPPTGSIYLYSINDSNTFRVYMLDPSGTETDLTGGGGGCTTLECLNDVMNVFYDEGYYLGGDGGQIVSKQIPHSDLISVQGGNSGEYYHINQSVYDFLIGLSGSSAFSTFNISYDNGIIWQYNQSDGSYNFTYQQFAYNETEYILSKGYLSNNSNGYFNTLSIGRTDVSSSYIFDVEGNVRIFGNLDVLGNLTFLNLQSLIINGSIIATQDAVFDIGNSSNRFRNGYFSDDIYLDGPGSVKTWLYNQSDGSYNITYQNYAYNQSDGSYNATYATWAYNQTPSVVGSYNATYEAYAYNETLAANQTVYDAYGRWFYNMTGGTSSISYGTNQTIYPHIGFISGYFYNWSKPSGSIEFGGNNTLRRYANLDGANQYRIHANIIFATANRNGSIVFQYSTNNGGTWTNLSNPSDTFRINRTGSNVSNWYNVTTNAKTNVLLRGVGYGTNTIVISFTELWLEFKLDISAFNASRYDSYAYNQSDGSYNISYDALNSTYGKYWYNQSDSIYHYNMSDGSGDGSYNLSYDLNITDNLKWWYNMSNTIYYYNMTPSSVGDGSYNSSYETNMTNNIKWWYNQSNTIYYYNQSDGSYNATYHGLNVSYNKFWYNMSNTIYYYNQTVTQSTYNATYHGLNVSYNKFWYNQSANIYYYNETLGAMNYINGTYGKWWYNQSNNRFYYNQSATIYYYNQTPPSTSLFYIATSSGSTNSIAIAGQATVAATSTVGVGIRGESFGDADSGGAGVMGYASGGAGNVGVIGCFNSIASGVCDVTTISGSYGIYSFGNARITGNLTGNQKLTIGNGNLSVSISGSAQATEGFRAVGTYTANGWTGAGIEMAVTGNTGYITAYNRSAASYSPIYVRGSAIYLTDNAGGTSIDIGGTSESGITIGDSDSDYPDISCDGQSTSDLCEFKTGIYNNGGTLYNEGVLAQRNYMQNDGASYSGRVYVNDDFEVADGYGVWAGGACVVGDCPSDETLKTNINQISNSSEKLALLKPSTYKFTDNKYGSTDIQYGLMAQDVEKVYPTWVINKTISSISLDDGKQTNESVKAIIYDQRLNMEMLNAINEHTAKLKAQQAEIDLLKSELCRLNKEYSWCV